MTIIGIAIYEKGKNGSLLMSRQFLPMCKTRLDALLYAFPKLHHLYAHDNNSIDGESVRYVYHNAYNVVFVLLTNRQSNLLNDISSLQLLSRLIYTVTYPDQYYNSTSISSGHQSNASSTPLTAAAIRKNLFEIFIAIDEIIEPGGYIGDVTSTVESVHTDLLMESHEEHRYNLLQREKMKDAKVVAGQKALELDRQKRTGGFSNDPAMIGRIVGIGSNSIQSSGSNYEHDRVLSSQNEEPQTPSSSLSPHPSNNSSTSQQPAPSKFEFTSSNQPNKQLSTASAQPNTILGKAAGRKLGGKPKMVLGKKKTRDEEVGTEDTHQISQIEPEQQQLLQQPSQSHNPSQSLPQQQHQQQQQQNQLTDIQIPHTKVEERISIQMDTENTVVQFSIQGKLSLLLPNSILHPNYAIQMHPSILSLYPALLKLQTRPGLDKTQWITNAILYNTDANKPFQPGIDKSNILLQWKVQSNNGSQIEQLGALLPFSFILWVSQNGSNSTSVSLECAPNRQYSTSTQTSTLNNIIVAIPCPSNPSLTQVDAPWKYDKLQKMLYWSLGSLLTATDQQANKIPSGSLFTLSSTIEFEVPDALDQEHFLPMNISFTAQSSYLGIQPVAVYDNTTSQQIEFGSISNVTLDGFMVTGQ